PTAICLCADLEGTPVRRILACLMTVVACLPPGAAGAELTVSAAASLGDVFKELAVQFERDVPGATVRLNVAASGVLLQQMAHGAPVDVLASADQATMDEAAARRLIDPSSRRDFAANSLVVAVPARGGASVATLQDLAAP